MSQDAKKDEFRKYLEKAGVLELLTKSLVSLYEVSKQSSNRMVLKNSESQFFPFKRVPAYMYCIVLAFLLIFRPLQKKS